MRRGLLLNFEAHGNHADRACDPSNFEPNIALQLEIADLVTSKKGNAYVSLLECVNCNMADVNRPREAATAIVQYVNHRNQHVAMMALSVLTIDMMEPRFLTFLKYSFLIYA